MEYLLDRKEYPDKLSLLSFPIPTQNFKTSFNCVDSLGSYLYAWLISNTLDLLIYKVTCQTLCNPNQHVMLELVHGKCTTEFVFAFVCFLIKFNIMSALYILGIFKHVISFKVKQVPLSLRTHVHQPSPWLHSSHGPSSHHQLLWTE